MDARPKFDDPKVGSRAHSSRGASGTTSLPRPHAAIGPHGPLRRQRRHLAAAGIREGLGPVGFEPNQQGQQQQLSNFESSTRAQFAN